jgi:hypothetical protein
MRRVLMAMGVAAMVAASVPGRAGEPLTVIPLPGQSIQHSIWMAQLKAAQAAILAERGRNGSATTATPATLPRIVSGEILTPRIEVGTLPAAPAVKLRYQTVSGISSVSGEFTSASTGQALYFTWGPEFGSAADGTVTIYQPTAVSIGFSGAASLQFGPFLPFNAGGTWTLTGLMLVDKDGRASDYGAAAIARLFPSTSIQVDNPLIPDVTPPVVLSGKILTPIVNLNLTPLFRASLDVQDDSSGVYTVVVEVEPKGQPEYLTSSLGTPAAAIRSGTKIAQDYLGGLPAGEWEIAAYAACDAAGNCVEDKTRDGVKRVFGTTTFTVKN